MRELPILLLLLIFTIHEGQCEKRGIRNYYTGKVSLGFDDIDMSKEQATIDYTGGVDFEAQGTEQVVPTREPPKPVTHVYGTPQIHRSRHITHIEEHVQTLPESGRPVPRKNLPEYTTQKPMRRIELKTSPAVIELATTEDPIEEEITDDEEEGPEEQTGTSGNSGAEAPAELPSFFNQQFGIFGNSKQQVFPLDKAEKAEIASTTSTSTTELQTTTTESTTTEEPTTRRRPRVPEARPTRPARRHNWRVTELPLIEETSKVPHTHEYQLSEIADQIEQQLEEKQPPKKLKKKRKSKKKRHSIKHKSTKPPTKEEDAPTDAPWLPSEQVPSTTINVKLPTTTMDPIEAELRRRALDELAEIEKEGVVTDEEEHTDNGSENEQTEMEQTTEHPVEVSAEEKRLKKLEKKRLHELRQKQRELAELQDRIRRKKLELLQTEQMEKQFDARSATAQSSHVDKLEAAKQELKERRMKLRMERNKKTRTKKSKKDRSQGPTLVPIRPDELNFPKQKHESSNSLKKANEDLVEKTIKPAQPKVKKPKVEEYDEIVEEITDDEDDTETPEPEVPERPKSYGIRTASVENREQKPTGYMPLKIQKLGPEKIVSPTTKEESYLGGWSDNQWAEPEPESIQSKAPPAHTPLPTTTQDSKAFEMTEEQKREFARKYYEEYYKEWSANQTTTVAPTTPAEYLVDPAANQPNVMDRAPPSAMSSMNGNPFMNPMLMMGGMVGGAMGTASPTVPPQQGGNMFGILDPRMNGQKDLSPQQLSALCASIYGASISFGIKDVKSFASNNCTFIKMYYKDATCEQIMHVLDYCETQQYRGQNSAGKKRK